MNPADRYGEVLEKLASSSVRETPPREGGISELALQARIYAGEFGLGWQGEDGETVEVVHFGAWNREPGPDFCGAKVLINGVEKIGEIEVDPDVRDWENHGHARNENYNNVVLHLFFRRGPRRFFTRTADNRAVVQVALAAPGGTVPPAPAPDSPLGENAARQLIEAAAQFRFRRKAERFQRSQRLCGHEEALFQAIATGLGYKNNKIPFLLVAQRAGLARAAAPQGEALLFGLAGFLRAEDFSNGDDEARTYLRDLWENWWALRAGESRLVLAEAAWKFSAVRPANHPHRRMGALAAVARSFRRIAKSSDPADFVNVLTSLEHAFWSVHYNLACERLPRATALIGEDRARELLINALLPSLPEGKAWEILQNLDGPSPSSRVRKALAWICGSEPPPFLRRAVLQQGLLQMYEDFFPCGAGEIWAQYSGGRARESLPPVGD